MIRSAPIEGPNDLITFLHYTENLSYLTFIGLWLCSFAHLLSLLLSFKSYDPWC